MGAAATAAVCEEQVQVRRPRRPCVGPGGVTIGQLLTRAHEAIQVGAGVSCPVCDGRVEPQSGEGRCGSCGTRLF
jgi:hypothetical protein